MQNVEQIFSAVNEIVEAERREYAPEPEADGAPESQLPRGLTAMQVENACKANEVGDALLYVHLNRGLRVYDCTEAQWYENAGPYWEADTTEKALAATGGVVDLYAERAMINAFYSTKCTQAGDDKKATQHHGLSVALNKRVKDMRALKRIMPVLHLARAGADSLGISGDEWDKKPMLLPVLNGVIDLTTGEMHDGRPENYLKAHAPVAWQGINKPCPTWESFMESTFDRDSELIEFMARLLGYCLTGMTTEAVLPIFWGTGRNGKTVMLEALAEVLGPDLSGPVESEFLLEQKFAKPSGGPSSDKLHLRGRRLAWLSETNENRRLNSGKVKMLTGGDTITGRAPYGKRQISFKPTHKMILLTNHRPKADARDQALWRRVLLIPFKMAFVPRPDPAKLNERLADAHLPAKLKAEGPGILAWLVRGCLAWQEEGLNPPESVLAATQEYQDGEDTIKTFISEKCIEGAERSCRAAALYSAYKSWQEGNGEKAMTANKFGKVISERFDSVKDMKGRLYVGLELCSNE